MAGLAALFDSNILIDYLQGVEAARAELQVHSRPLVSAISCAELLAGARKEEMVQMNLFLDRFEIVSTTRDVAMLAANLRREFRLRLPDALIWASAKDQGALLVTRDSDFPTSQPDIRVPYKL